LARGRLASLLADEKAALARDFDRLLGLDLGVPPGRRPADPFRGAVSSARGVPDASAEVDRCRLSVNVVVQAAEDLAAVGRCVGSILRHRGSLDLEVMLIDATGLPAAHGVLARLGAASDRVRLLWIDHDPGAGAARNLGLRTSRGTHVALMDPSVELIGDAWAPLLAVLGEPSVGGVGPFGLLTSDMRHYYELDSADPSSASRSAAAPKPVEVDALQNYLMVFRRSDLARIGPLDEHYRFYRILDLDLSYAIRDRVGRLMTLSGLPLVRHRHALWEALSEGDREERSRKNFGRFLKRWDHHAHHLHRHGDDTQLVGEAVVHG
jgi:GT2 family glycosyltransferase